MAITYDFDMFSIIPKEVQAEFGGMFSELGVTDMMAEQKALFRDPAAVEALRGASPDVQKCMLESGFGLNVYDSGAGAGRFPASDGPARAQVIERLMENLEGLPEDVDWNGFDIEAFAMAALQAKPLDAPERSFKEMRRAASSPEPEQSGSGGSSMDSFFSGTPQPSPASRPESGPDMDAFFSNAPAARPAAAEAPRPNMDDFFSNAATPGSASQAPREMSAEDIRSTIDTAPPKKIGFGKIQMGLMALGLYLVIMVIANGGGATKFFEAATGAMDTKMVTVTR